MGTGRNEVASVASQINHRLATLNPLLEQLGQPRVPDVTPPEYRNLSGSTNPQVERDFNHNLVDQLRKQRAAVDKQIGDAKRALSGKGKQLEQFYSGEQGTTRSFSEEHGAPPDTTPGQSRDGLSTPALFVIGVVAWLILKR